MWFHDHVTASSGPQGQEMFRVSVVPARAAYLIKPQSRSGLRRAVQEASTRWGGATEPIIPVRAGGIVNAWWRQVVELSAVDGLVNVDVDDDHAKKAAQDLGLPLTRLKHIDKSGVTQFTSHPSHLSHGSTFGDTAHIARSSAELWEVVAIGDLTPEHEADFAVSTLQIARPATPDWAGRAQVSRSSLLDLTLSEFSEHRGQGWMGPYPAIIWVTKPNSFGDCLWFWNIRALRPLRFEDTPMIIVPHRGVENWLNFAEQLEHVLRRPAQFSPDVAITSHSADVPAMHNLAEILGFVESTEEPEFRRAYPPPATREPPYQYRLDLDVRTFVSFSRTYGVVADINCQIYSEGTLVEGDNPVQFQRPGRTLLKFDSPALAPIPRRPELAKLLDRNASWSPDGRLELATRLTQQIAQRLRMPSLRQVALQVMKVSPISLETSEKGQLGLRLREMGVLEVLLMPGASETIRSLQTPRSKELRRELKSLTLTGDIDERRLVELAMAWGGRAERRHQSIDEMALSSERALRAVEALALAGWVERGLHVKCSVCTLRTFVRLVDAIDSGGCPACGAKGGYELIDSGPQVRYRLHALLDRASDQGVVPHLQAIAVLTEASKSTWLVPGVNVGPGSKSPNEVAEVDLFGIHDGEVIAGEVKTYSGQFDKDQIERDVRLSSTLGADVHVMATSEGQFSASQLDLATDLADSANIGLLVLEGNEIRSLDSG